MVCDLISQSLIAVICAGWIARHPCPHRTWLYPLITHKYLSLKEAVLVQQANDSQGPEGGGK